MSARSPRTVPAAIKVLQGWPFRVGFLLYLDAYIDLVRELCTVEPSAPECSRTRGAKRLKAFASQSSTKELTRLYLAVNRRNAAAVAFHERSGVLGKVKVAA